MTLSQALRDLNNAAYAAAKAARAENSYALSDELRKLALRTDEMVDALPPQPAMQEAAE